MVVWSHYFPYVCFAGFFLFWLLLFSYAAFTRFFSRASYSVTIAVCTILFYGCFFILCSASMPLWGINKKFSLGHYWFACIAIACSLAGIFGAWLFSKDNLPQGMLYGKKNVWTISLKDTHVFDRTLKNVKQLGAEILLEDVEKQFVIGLVPASIHHNQEYVIEVFLRRFFFLNRITIVCYPAQKGQFVEGLDLNKLIDLFLLEFFKK